MPASLVKTKTPGIYKRGGRYVFSYRANSAGTHAGTLDEAVDALSGKAAGARALGYRERPASGSPRRGGAKAKNKLLVRLAIPLDPVEAMRGLLKVDPDSEPATHDDPPSGAGHSQRRND